MSLCWIVTEGLAGTENQCLGVAEALGVMPVVKRINLRQPWKLLSPYIGFETKNTFTGDALEPPWPDLLIAAGRKAIAAARYIKRASGGKTFTVFLQDPRIDPAAFDLVVVPAHDPTRGDNVVVTQAAPNRVNFSRLKNARKDFETLLSPLPDPRVAVMIGGSSNAYTLTPDLMTKLAGDLRALAAQGFGLMVTASRRTGEGNRDILVKELKDTNAYLWNGTGDNPYFGFLAWADFILVTADSVSMISEAATTGKPVYIVPLEGGADRIGRLHQNLLEKGVVRLFEGKLEAYSYPRLDDAGFVAEEIRKRLGKS